MLSMCADSLAWFELTLNRHWFWHKLISSWTRAATLRQRIAPHAAVPSLLDTYCLPTFCWFQLSQENVVGDARGTVSQPSLAFRNQSHHHASNILQTMYHIVQMIRHSLFVRLTLYYDSTFSASLMFQRGFMTLKWSCWLCLVISMLTAALWLRRV